MEISYLYIITDGIAHKVGISKNPLKRLKSLQTSNPNKLTILEAFPVPEHLVFKIEKECHQMLQTKFAKRGEWFQKSTHFAIRLVIDEVIDRYINSSRSLEE